MLANFDQVRAMGTAAQAALIAASAEPPSAQIPLFSSIQVTYESKSRKKPIPASKLMTPDGVNAGFERSFSTPPRAASMARQASAPVARGLSTDDEEEEKQMFTHQFSIEGLRFNWNIDTRNVIYRIFNTFTEARQLKFDLTMSALRPQSSSAGLQAGYGTFARLIG